MLSLGTATQYISLVYLPQCLVYTSILIKWVFLVCCLFSVIVTNIDKVALFFFFFLLFLGSSCLTHLCSAWAKQSMFSAVSWSSAALSNVLQLFMTLSCSGHWLCTVLSPVPLFKSLQMPKWCEPLQFWYLFPNTRWCLGFTYSQTMSCFCGLWYCCHRSHFPYAVSHICQNYPSSMSFSLGRVASFSSQVVVGLFFHLLTISLCLSPVTL